MAFNPAIWGCIDERGLHSISAALVLSNGFWGCWTRGLFCLGKKLLGVAGVCWWCMG